MLPYCVLCCHDGKLGKLRSLSFERDSTLDISEHKIHGEGTVRGVDQEFNSVRLLSLVTLTSCFVHREFKPIFITSPLHVALIGLIRFVKLVHFMSI